MKIKLSLALLALISSLQAEEVITLQPLSITSTAITTNELKSSDAVEVYTAQEIEKAHVQNVYEFLNSQTSVTTMPSYGNPFSQKLDMHGYGIGDGYQNIIITVDGRKINNIDMVAPLLNAIAPSSIQRIEIIKSSGIVTAGDGANAGVINIITKKNNDKEVMLYGGTYGAASGSFSLGHSDENLSLSASGEAQKNAGIRPIDAQGNKDENRLSTGAFHLAYTPTKELELRLSASFARTDVAYGGAITQEEYEENPAQQGSSTPSHLLYDADALSAGVSYFVNEAFFVDIDTNHEKKKSQNITYAFISDYVYNSAKITLNSLSDVAQILVGLDTFDGTRNAHASLYAAANETTKKNLAGFIMTHFALENSSIKAGYRYENVKYAYNNPSQNLEQENFFNGFELGFNYTLSKQTSLFANFSHSYQAPDIDRFFSFYGGFNEFISPAHANNFTVGFTNIDAQNKLKISAYYIDLRDEIYYYADPTYLNSKNTNIDKSHKYGLDVYDKYLFSSFWNIALNYNYVQALIDKEGENGDDYAGNHLPGVSNHNAKVTLGYLPNGHAAFALTQIYRSEAYAADDFKNNFLQKQDSFISTDFSATYTKNNWEIFAKVNNLFNQKNALWVRDDAIYPVNFTTTAMAGVKVRY